MDILFVIEREAGDRSFEYVLNGYAFVIGYLAKHVAKVECDGSREMHFQIFIILILHHVVLVELGETTVYKLITIGLLEVLKNELC